MKINEWVKMTNSPIPILKEWKELVFK
jgi:hypothetical protein